MFEILEEIVKMHENIKSDSFVDIHETIIGK